MMLDTMFNDLKIVVKNTTIKYESLAREAETVDTRRESDRYIAAVLQYDSFRSYAAFDKEAIALAGVVDVFLATKYAEDKSLIPQDMQGKILDAQRKVIIANYTEKNNYYRSLIGLPDLDDTTIILLPLELARTHHIDPLTPIHLLSNDDLLKLQKSGDIEQLYALYPDKAYLKFLGVNKIDLVRARTSSNFGILKIPTNVNEAFYDDFMFTYEQARTYFASVIYNKEFGRNYDYYDNYIGMMIMVMTIQRLFVNTFRYGIERDFYDLSSIEMLFNAYNVPFIEKLPIEYQRILVRNLNNLLYYKSTDKVLYDICSLLGFERINIFKYYLIKEHKLDENERPLFIMKTVDNGDGTTRQVYDTEKMYSLYFQAVELNERNTALALTNTINRIDYEQVVNEDIFWWSDDDTLKQKLYDTEFNYIETKYLSMNIMYKLTEMLFEIIYVFRMMVDKSSETKNVMLSLPKITNEREVSLFHTTAILCALISKKNGFTGEIISTPSKTMSILGFNFGADFEAIRKTVQSNRLLDNRILTYIQNMNVYSADDVNKLYVNIKELADFLVERMAETQNRKQYEAYRKIYETLMITDNVSTMFTKSDGTVATTYLDFIEDYDFAIGEYIREIEVDAIAETVEHILYRLNLLLKDLRHLYIVNDSNNVTMEAVIKLIKFFKSYTTDLTSFNILYLMDSRYSNMIKLLGNVKSVSSSIRPKTSMIVDYKDAMKYAVNLAMRDKAFLSDRNREFALTKQIYGKSLTSMDYKHKRQLTAIIHMETSSVYMQADVTSAQTTLRLNTKMAGRDVLFLTRE